MTKYKDILSMVKLAYTGDARKRDAWGARIGRTDLDGYVRGRGDTTDAWYVPRPSTSPGELAGDNYNNWAGRYNERQADAARNNALQYERQRGNLGASGKGGVVRDESTGAKYMAPDSEIVHDTRKDEKRMMDTMRMYERRKYIKEHYNPEIDTSKMFNPANAKILGFRIPFTKSHRSIQEERARRLRDATMGYKADIDNGGAFNDANRRISLFGLNWRIPWTHSDERAMEARGREQRGANAVANEYFKNLEEGYGGNRVSVANTSIPTSTEYKVYRTPAGKIVREYMQPEADTRKLVLDEYGNPVMSSHLRVAGDATNQDIQNLSENMSYSVVDTLRKAGVPVDRMGRTENTIREILAQPVRGSGYDDYVNSWQMKAIDKILRDRVLNNEDIEDRETKYRQLYQSMLLNLMHRQRLFR